MKQENNNNKNKNCKVSRFGNLRYVKVTISKKQKKKKGRRRKEERICAMGELSKERNQSVTVKGL